MGSKNQPVDLSQQSSLWPTREALYGNLASITVYVRKMLPALNPDGLP